MNPTLLCVLRSGGVYRPEHVHALYDDVRIWWPYAKLRFVCLTDMAVSTAGRDFKTYPLVYQWPGWWSKLECFRPDVEFLGDVLFMDLDTRIVGDLVDIARTRTLTVLRDFYRGTSARGDHIGSGLMYIPIDDRAEVWEQWIEDPEQWQRRTRRGDQAFLETLWKERAERWQDLLPDQVVSYKVHVRFNGGVPPNARVVCFHGNPRPWTLPGWRSYEDRESHAVRQRRGPQVVHGTNHESVLSPNGALALPRHDQSTPQQRALSQRNHIQTRATIGNMPEPPVVVGKTPSRRRSLGDPRPARIPRGVRPPGSGGPPPLMDYAGEDFRPGLLHPERALVLGGGSGVWDEVLAVEKIYGRSWDGVVIGVNDVGAHWPRHLDHWTSLHPEKFPPWKALREQYGFNTDYITWGRRERMVDRTIRPWGGGSSGLLAVVVAYELGCQRVVLCGIPLTRTPHFGESLVHQRKKDWPSADAHWRVWQRLGDRLRGWVTSMSGRTRGILGMPTREWLEGTTCDVQGGVAPSLVEVADGKLERRAGLAHDHK